MKRVGVIVFPRFGMVDLACLPVFELAKTPDGKPAYSVELLSEEGGPVMSSSGVSVNTERFSDAAFDTLMMAGGTELEPSTPGIISFLQAGALRSRRITSICTGAFFLAEAGILDGRRATTHWVYSVELQRRFPRVRVDADRIYTSDGAVWTSAGMMACIDLALALVESDLGSEVARDIARKLVIYHRRAGGQSQFSALLELAPKSDRIQDALSYAKEHLKQPLSVGVLAGVANLSPRQFSRTFRAETGQSPARGVEKLRVEVARELIESGRHSVEVVARETGFADPERMRRAFIRAFGQPPQALRRAVRHVSEG
jgi:transcriptional regulator GlxA family with amidase domain